MKTHSDVKHEFSLRRGQLRSVVKLYVQEINWLGNFRVIKKVGALNSFASVESSGVELERRDEVKSQLVWHFFAQGSARITR